MLCELPCLHMVGRAFHMEVLRSSLTHLSISSSSSQPSRQFSIPSTPNTLLPEFGSTRIHGFSTTRIAFSFQRAYGNSSWRSCPVGAEVRAMGLQLKNEIDGNVQQSKHPDRQGLRRKKLAVFVSGGGSNFRAIHQATLTDDIYGDVVVLITDKPGCGASDYARNSDIPIFVFPKSTFSSGGLSTMDLVTTLRQFEIDFLLLAGYLKLLPIELVQAYPRSILNIHPSLLPAFGGKGYYGIKVHKAVIASGARFSGPTVHYVDEKYDTGQILAQRVVPVLANDTAEDLAARVLQEEHLLYVEVVAAICEERIHWREDGVPLIRKSCNRDEYY